MASNWLEEMRLHWLSGATPAQAVASANLPKAWVQADVDIGRLFAHWESESTKTATGLFFNPPRNRV